MNLRDEIIKVVELQTLDTQIYNLREKKDVEKPQQLEGIKADLDKNKEIFSTFEEKLKALQLSKKESEIELAAKEENLKKAQTQLYQLKTNKEYQAKLTEIGSLKADISVAEDKVLKALEDIEVITKDFNLQKDRLGFLEQECKLKESKIQSEIRDMEAKIKNFNEKRQVLAAGIDKEIFFQYERSLKKRQGLAVVAVFNNNCSACNLLLNPQKINEIKMYKNLVFCENCVRILYIPEDAQ